MQSIRQLATSAAGSAALGAAIGGGIAYGTGGDIKSGIMSGAVYGGGARLAAGGLSAASRYAGSKMPAVGNWAKDKMIWNNLKRQALPLGQRGSLNTKYKALMMTQRYSNKLQTGFSKMTNAVNKITGLNSGVVAGGMAGAASLMGSSGEKTFAQSSLSEREAYLENIRKMQMNYNLQEAIMKKQIWAGA